jgi:transcriptional regulator with XRE-family HTH domain
MPRRSIGRSLKAVRRRLGWRQADLAAAAGVSQPTISRIERDRIDGITLGSLRACVAALGGYLFLDLRWQGERIDLLTDADHAALQNQMARQLKEWGWTVLVEVSFNVYGERGRMDILAYHPVAKVLLVVEIKSRIEDAQETIGRLNIKVRQAPPLAREHGWSIGRVIPALIVADDRTSHRRVGDHPALFAGLSLRGRSALRWLRRPGSDVPTGLLAFIRPEPPPRSDNHS